MKNFAAIESVDGEIIGCTIYPSELRARECAAGIACRNADMNYSEAMADLKTIGRIDDGGWSVSVAAARNEGESN